MALIEIGFFSETLGMCVNCNVILPQPVDPETPLRDLPVLYLLHGYGKDHTAWCRMTGIERYANHYGIAVVMPDAQNSTYEDMAHGLKWYTYLTEELPEAMLRFFPISASPENTYVLGASMGGCGALKMGLRRPEKYAAVGSMSSGFTALNGFLAEPDVRGISMNRLIFGEEGPQASDKKLLECLAALKDTKSVPRFYISVGDQDELVRENVRVAVQAFADAGVPLCHEEYPGGHTWAFWDAHLCDFLNYCGLKPVQGMC